ncbi:MAG: hypothetical protein LUD02_04235 [Tannerellaceae bacterium]|nr:hypothetical protein [Tannerellaceae bacterium]
MSRVDFNRKSNYQQYVRRCFKKLGKAKINLYNRIKGRFLQREGCLEEKEDKYQLKVEVKSYDILLDSIPWNFHTINYSWMEKPLFVNWR